MHSSRAGNQAGTGAGDSPVMSMQEPPRRRVQVIGATGPPRLSPEVAAVLLRIVRKDLARWPNRSAAPSDRRNVVNR